MLTAMLLYENDVLRLNCGHALKSGISFEEEVLL